MPSERKATSWANVNFGFPSSPRTYRDLYIPVLKREHTFAPLFAKIDEIDSPYKIRREFRGVRYWTWNFSNIEEPKVGHEPPCGTIEFRRPPGSQSVVEARHWVSFALSFIFMAVRTKWVPKYFTKIGTDAQLREFVFAGQRELPQACQGSLTPSLLRKFDAAPLEISEEELCRIEELKKEKDKESSPFVLKVSSLLQTGSWPD